MHHEMSLRPGPFAMIADGRKRYELRLHDEKRRAITVGDTITFVCAAYIPASFRCIPLTASRRCMMRCR